MRSVDTLFRAFASICVCFIRSKWLKKSQNLYHHRSLLHFLAVWQWITNKPNGNDDANMYKWKGIISRKYLCIKFASFKFQWEGVVAERERASVRMHKHFNTTSLLFYTCGCTFILSRATTVNSLEMKSACSIRDPEILRSANIEYISKKYAWTFEFNVNTWHPQRRRRRPRRRQQREINWIFSKLKRNFNFNFEVRWWFGSMTDRMNKWEW